MFGTIVRLFSYALCIFPLHLVVHLDFALAENLSPILRTLSGVNPSGYNSGNNSEAVPIRLSLPGILILSIITQHLKMVVYDGSRRGFFLIGSRTLVPRAPRDLVLKPFF